jgi:hypothetical protein
MNVIGPGITVEDLQSGRKTVIDVFEGIVTEWILSYADFLASEHPKKEHAGTAILILASAVLEPMGGIVPIHPKVGDGKGDIDVFSNGFLRVFPEVPGTDDPVEVAKTVYRRVRSGLFHEAFIKPGVRLESMDTAVCRHDDGVIAINPERFLHEIQMAFAKTMTEIRQAEEGDEIRSRFREYWSKGHKRHDGVQLKKQLADTAIYPSQTGTCTLAITMSDPGLWIDKNRKG